MHYSLVDKQLGFKLREKVTTKFGFEVKAKGLFNTVTGGIEYRATALKNITLGDRVKDAGSTPLNLGKEPSRNDAWSAMHGRHHSIWQRR